MKKPLQKRIIEALHSVGAAPGDGILAAVSGGADSMALLHLLHTLGYAVCAGHVEHGLRAQDSVDDMRFVMDWCRKNGVRCLVRRVDAAALKGKGISTEAAAREARYRALNEMKAEAEVKWIAVAHHEDDQAETLLLHILRGSGHGGLGGMRMRSGDVIRPMLRTAKAEILRYCRAQDIEYRQDATNDDCAFTRNRIRHELIPYLEKRFNPSFTAAASRLCLLAAMDEDYLDAEAQRAFVRCVSLQDGARIDLAQWKELPDALRYRTAHKALCACVGEEAVAYAHVQSLCALSEAGTGAGVDLPGGWLARQGYGAIHIAKTKTRRPYCQDVLVGGETCTPYGVLYTRVLERKTLPEGPYAQYFDADAFPADACLRTRREGDRMRPLGLGGEKKLQDIFVDAKVPRHLRDTWPLVAADAVLWVVGVRRSESAKVKEETSRFLYMAYEPEANEGGTVDA